MFYAFLWSDPDPDNLTGSGSAPGVGTKIRSGRRLQPSYVGCGSIPLGGSGFKHEKS